MPKIAQGIKAWRMSVSLQGNPGDSTNARSQFWVARSNYVAALKAASSGSSIDIVSYERRFVATIDAAWTEFIRDYPNFNV